MKMRIVSIIVGLLFLTGLAAAKKYPLTADKSVPAARGQVDVGQDKNGNTEVEIEVEHLAGPESLRHPEPFTSSGFRNVAPNLRTRVD